MNPAAWISRHLIDHRKGRLTLGLSTSACGGCVGRLLRDRGDSGFTVEDWVLSVVAVALLPLVFKSWRTVLRHMGDSQDPHRAVEPGAVAAPLSHVRTRRSSDGEASHPTADP